jgi:hypothetical protein
MYGRKTLYYYDRLNVYFVYRTGTWLSAVDVSHCIYI